MCQRDRVLTVDGNGHALGEDVTIRAAEDGNLGKRTQLEKLLAALGWVSGDEFDVELVLLRNGQESACATIFLQRTGVSLRRIELMGEGGEGEREWE